MKQLYLSRFFSAACYIRDVAIPRQRLVKLNEEILKWFPYGGIAFMQNSDCFHSPN